MNNDKVKLPVARKMANLTQVELANKIGVSESTIINWEKYRSYPTIDQAKAVGDACGMHYDRIDFLP